MQILSVTARTEICWFVSVGNGMVKSIQVLHENAKIVVLYFPPSGVAFLCEWLILSPGSYGWHRAGTNVLQCLVSFSAFLSGEHWKVSEMSKLCGNFYAWYHKSQNVFMVWWAATESTNSGFLILKKTKQWCSPFTVQSGVAKYEGYISNNMSNRVFWHKDIRLLLFITLTVFSVLFCADWFVVFFSSPFLKLNISNENLKCFILDLPVVSISLFQINTDQYSKRSWNYIRSDLEEEEPNWRRCCTDLELGLFRTNRLDSDLIFLPSGWR